MLFSGPAMRTVSSRHNPLVRTFRDVAARSAADGRLLLDGMHLIRDAYEAGLTLETVAFSSGYLSDNHDADSLVRDLDHAGVDLVRVSESIMSALSPVRAPSGIVAIAAHAPSDPQAVWGHPRALIVAAVDVQDPGNLGALVRAAEAGGATGALVCGRSAHPFSWKALRGSMGSALRLPVAIIGTAQDALALAQRHGVRTVAAVPRGGKPPETIRWREPIALFLGGEGIGLSTELINRCHEIVSIPMQPPVESLNIAVAGALLVYEAHRQRGQTPATQEGVRP